MGGEHVGPHQHLATVESGEGAQTLQPRHVLGAPVWREGHTERAVVHLRPRWRTVGHVEDGVPQGRVEIEWFVEADVDEGRVERLGHVGDQFTGQGPRLVGGGFQTGGGFVPTVR